MKIGKKDYYKTKLLKECFETISGYFYLIEMNLLLLEYEYTEKLLYDYHFKNYDDPKGIIRH